MIYDGFLGKMVCQP